MRREQSNQIRYILEELLPPAVRDTGLFRFTASLAWGRHISALAKFRKSAPFVTAEEYTPSTAPSAVHEGYRQFPSLSRSDRGRGIRPNDLRRRLRPGVLLQHVRSNARGDLTTMFGSISRARASVRPRDRIHVRLVENLAVRRQRLRHSHLHALSSTSWTIARDRGRRRIARRRPHYRRAAPSARVSMRSIRT